VCNILLEVSESWNTAWLRGYRREAVKRSWEMTDWNEAREVSEAMSKCAEETEMKRGK
jgi:hypothetical protein